ncbi:hypothetical protein LINPERHAP1_LOCUS20394 [Linum perenne]
MEKEGVESPVLGMYLAAGGEAESEQKKGVDRRMRMDLAAVREGESEQTEGCS